MKKNRIGLRLKLVGVIVPIVLMIIIIYFVLARNMIVDISMDKVKADSKVYAGDIGIWTEEIFSELDIYKDAINGGYFADNAAILEFMKSSYEKNPAYPIGLYMGDDSGMYLDASDWVPGDDWVLVERDWYIDGKDNEEFAFGEPYYDSMTGQVCVSASVRMDYTPAVRVLATDVYLDYVSEKVRDISSSQDIKVFIVTKSSKTIIAHPDSKMVAISLDNNEIDSMYAKIADVIEEESTDTVKIKGDNDKYYVSVNMIDNTDWCLVSYVDESVVLKELNKTEIVMFVIAVIATTLLVVIILTLTNQVVKPVAKVTGIIDDIAKGDFTHNITIKGSDEIATMSNNMNKFVANMRSTISEIRDTANWLNKQSVDNEVTSSSLMSSAESQERVMRKLDNLANELSIEANEVSNQMGQLLELIGHTYGDGQCAKALMSESVVMSQKGKLDMEKINEGMESINQTIGTLALQIENVGNAMIRIDNMVNIIMDIAEETNLLSLNASIEAARAGEAGRGFGVVAEQIGKLAINSSSAADDIAKITLEIKNTVDSAMLHMNTSIDAVANNTDAVADAKIAFVELNVKVEETNNRVEEIIERVGRVNDIVENMDNVLEKQQSAVLHIVDSTKEMQETTNNVSTNSRMVDQSAKELKKESVELIKKISRFKV